MKVTSCLPDLESERMWSFWMKTAFFGLGIALLGALYGGAEPKFGVLQYNLEGMPSTQGALPLSVPGKGGNIRITITIDLYPLHATSFVAEPDDCIDTLAVDGVSVDDPATHFCDTHIGRSVDLSHYLHTGRNILTFTIRDLGGDTGLNLRPDHFSTVELSLLCYALLLTVWYLFVIAKYWSLTDASPLVLFAVGTAVRVLYVLATPYTERSHDSGAHIDYVRYVAQNLGIPPANGGWEYHQAPLYYLLAGLWMKGQLLLGRTEQSIIGDLRVASLVLSIATFAVALWIGRLLWWRRKQRPLFILFGGIVATFPSLVYLSARTYNDALYHLFAFLVVALLLRWWQSGRLRDWYLLIALASVAYLTKASGLLLVGGSFLSLALYRKWRWRAKATRAVLAGCVVLLLTGWYPALRFVGESDHAKTLTFGNQGMSSGLSVSNRVTNFLTFNPLEILRKPYNNPWDDSMRRQYFWEYLFRSAFFGEFSFPPALRSLSVLLLGIGMSLIPLGIYGLTADLRCRRGACPPMLVIGGLLLAGALGYRVAFPYAPNQDFRFSVLLLIPAVYYALRGIEQLRGSSKAAGQALTGLLAFLSGIFVLSLYLF